MCSTARVILLLRLIDVFVGDLQSERCRVTTVGVRVRECVCPERLLLLMKQTLFIQEEDRKHGQIRAFTMGMA